ncbi:MAG: MBL fold metallo-hydrolase, partial [Pirellulales bacterium]
DRIIEYLDAHGLTPALLLITHGHSDHIGGNEALKERWPDCPIVVGRRDAPKLSNPMLNLSAAFGAQLISPPADRLVDEGDTVDAAGLTMDVREIPGHSLGHVVFILRDTSPIVVLGGDVLFAGSVGRTDFPDGDFNQLQRGIHEKLFVLPDDTQILPGHGPPTTIGQEKRTNPFVGAPSGYLA